MRCPHCGAPNSDDARFCGACGGATQATEPSSGGGGATAGSAPDLAGREIAGRYRILTKLGEGGMGAVYRGEQISLKRKVAIKLLKPELSADANLVRRFNAEAELAARLSHPNTVNIYDFGQDVDGTLFIAMEYVEGRSLRSVMTVEGPLAARRSIKIAAQIAGSLTDAHSHGIVHRDLKPDNVMLTERGKHTDIVRVLDFGIAKLRDEGKNTVNAMTQAGDLVGTPQYMAPEQIRGDKVDGRTDVYALGTMLYEIVTGRLPFEGANVMAILSKHLTETPTPPSVRRPDLAIPPALDQVVLQAMAKDPAARVPSMELFGEHLAAIGATLDGVTGPRSAAVPIAAGGWQPGMPTRPASAAGPTATPAPTGVPGMAPGLGAPIPATPIPAPATPPATGPTAATPLPYPHGTPPPGPMAAGAAPRRRRAGPWIALGLVAAAGAAVAVVLATRSSGGGGQGSGSSAPAGDDPWAGTAQSAPPASAHDPDPAPAGSTYHDPSGWSVILPPGVSDTPQISQQNGTTVSGFFGTIDGQLTGIALMAEGGVDPDMSDADAMRAINRFASGMSGTLVSFDFPTIQGQRRLRGIIDVGSNRLETVLYVHQPLSLIVMYGTPRAGFTATEAARRELFERRVIAP